MVRVTVIQQIYMRIKALVFPLLIVGLFLVEEASAQPYSYLALGDSYTIGEKVSPDHRWPVLLADALNKLGYSFSDPEIIATTGWTTQDLKAGIEKADIDPVYSLVTLLIGVNNQYRGYDIEIFKREFEQLLKRAIELTGSRPDHLLVLSIPDYGVTPFAEEKNPPKISREIHQYNAIKKSITQQYGVSFVDITPISKKAADDSTLLAGDQLHPSGEMYHMWVDKALPVLISQIKKWDSQTD